jgi:hypothetical protein
MPGQRANGWGREAGSGIGTMEELEYLRSMLTYLSPKRFSENAFGGIDTQAFAFGGEPNIKVMKIRDKGGDAYNSISSRSLAWVSSTTFVTPNNASTWRARPSMVGVFRKALTSNGTLKVSLTRTATCAASNECPPI